MARVRPEPRSLEDVVLVVVELGRVPVLLVDRVDLRHEVLRKLELERRNALLHLLHRRGASDDRAIARSLLGPGERHLCRRNAVPSFSPIDSPESVYL